MPKRAIARTPRRTLERYGTTLAKSRSEAYWRAGSLNGVVTVRRESAREKVIVFAIGLPRVSERVNSERKRRERGRSEQERENAPLSLALRAPRSRRTIEKEREKDKCRCVCDCTYVGECRQCERMRNGNVFIATYQCSGPAVAPAV